MPKAEPKTYVVTYRKDKLMLETDTTKPRALEALLRLILREWYRANPDKLDAFMVRVNMEHQMAKGRNAPPQLQDPEMERLDFDFWRRLMEEVPHAQG